MTRPGSLVFALPLLVALLLAPAAPVGPAVAAPQWTGKIAFQSNRDGKTRIWVLLPFGSAMEIPNQPAGGKASGPEWHRDGNRVLFYSGKSLEHDAWVISQDGSSVENVTNSPGVDDRGPSWIPLPLSVTDEAIVWSSNLGGGVPRLYAMSLTDRAPIRCDRGIPSGIHNSRPVISPVGAVLGTRGWTGRIAYNSTELLGPPKDKAMVADFRYDPDQNLCEMTNRRVVFPKGREWRPGWLASGGEIVTAHTENGDPCVKGKEVYRAKIPADLSGGTPDQPVGFDITRLTCEINQQYAPVGEPLGGATPQILYTSQETGDQGLYLMNYDGSGKVNLTNPPGANDAQPSWWQGP